MKLFRNLKRLSFTGKFFLCARIQTSIKGKFFVLKDFVLSNGKLKNTFLLFKIQAPFHQYNLPKVGGLGLQWLGGGTGAGGGFPRRD